MAVVALLVGVLFSLRGSSTAMGAPSHQLPSFYGETQSPRQLVKNPVYFGSNNIYSIFMLSVWCLCQNDNNTAFTERRTNLDVCDERTVTFNTKKNIIAFLLCVCGVRLESHLRPMGLAENCDKIKIQLAAGLFQVVFPPCMKNMRT